MEFKEKRQRALTDDDIEAIRAAVNCDQACFFSEPARETLISFAQSTQKIKRITVTMTIVGVVGAILSGIATGFWLTLRHFITGVK